MHHVTGAGNDFRLCAMERVHGFVGVNP
jgi:hypothetical protein